MPYDPEFITGHNIPLPIPNESLLDGTFGGDYIHHTRHSLLFSADRGFAFVSASNVDGATLANTQFTSRSFKNDPNIQPTTLQVNRNRGYRTSVQHGFGPNPWDQGHLARRKSMSWGDEAEARSAERESDLWSNIVPQHESLHDDAWGKIEDWMLERVEGHGHRACVFTGPVFTDADPIHKNGANEDPIRIPAGFWKIISVPLSGQMRSAGFLVWQRDYDSKEPLGFSPVLEQVRLTTIEVLTGLTFSAIRQFDPLLFDLEANFRGNSAQDSSELRTRIANNIGTEDVDTEVVSGLISEAVSQGTSAIFSKRDIVL